MGSPIPIKDRVVDGLDASASARLVDDLGRGQIPPEAHLPVAQNAQVSGQPDCDETQTERRRPRSAHQDGLHWMAGHPANSA